MTIGRRTVVLLGEPDVTHAVEDALDADAPLRPRQRAARARVDAAPEGDVGLGVGTVEPELGGRLELAGVAVGRAVEQHDGRPRGDVDAGDGRRAPGQAEVRLDRALDAQRLLNEVGDALGVRPDLEMIDRSLI